MVEKVKALKDPYDEQDRQYREEKKRRELVRKQKIAAEKEAYKLKLMEKLSKPKEKKESFAR